MVHLETLQLSDRKVWGLLARHLPPLLPGGSMRLMSPQQSRYGGCCSTASSADQAPQPNEASVSSTMLQRGAHSLLVPRWNRSAGAWSRQQVFLVRCTAGGAPPHPPPLHHSVEKAGLTVQQTQQLRTYLDYMLEINQSMNLTAVRDPDEAWQRHIVDSLALLPVMDQHLAVSLRHRQPVHVQVPAEAAVRARKQPKGRTGRGRDLEAKAAENQAASSSSMETGGIPDASTSSSSSHDQCLRLIDVGTGAGLPGMVIAVARPRWKVTLLDSLRKRCDFLKQAAERAGITNVEVVWSRAEEGGQNPTHRERYDIAVARAVAETRVLAELCLPFVRVGGLWFAAKGACPQVEVEAARPAIETLGGKLLAIDLVESFSADGQRTAVVASKFIHTPAKFPRKPGTPNHQPL